MSYLSYPASLPERALRAGAALTGGLAYEAAELLLPRVLRGTRLYQATVDRLLRIIIEGIGGVEGVYAADTLPLGEFVARKATGNAVEMASILALGVSPVWVLAALSDLTGGTKTYLEALEAELRRTGILDPETRVASVEELLGVLERTSGAASDIADLPPLNVAELRRSWQALQTSVGQGWQPESAELGRVFADLQEVAREEGSSLLAMSGLVAAGALRAGARLSNEHILGYYREALSTISSKGLLHYLRDTARPYMRQVLRHFDPRRPSYTERWIARQRKV